MEYFKLTKPDNKLNKARGGLCQFVGDFGLKTQSNSNEWTEMTKSEFYKTNRVDDSDDLVLQGLINRIMAQDQSAFTTLFKMMAAKVHSLALRLTGCKQLAEEVAEDTFFQVWRQAPRFDPSRGTAKAWILTIARSRALDALRSIPPFDELPEPETLDIKESQSRDDPPNFLSAVEQNHLLHRAMEILDPLPRQLIALSYFRGLSHEEIANHTDLPLGTVKSHIRRAVIHLREALLNPSHQS